ncbi:MAG: ROK family glucokinase [Lachnospiraceae bacterium]|nr:ROK family glucokinase [Lachnospiraceae bacterium]
MKKYGFGVDIGGTTCKIGLFETAGQIVEKWEIPTDTREEGKNILADIAASLSEKMAERKIGKDEIEGIGVGIPGPVKPDGSVSVCVNLGWKNRNIPEELGKLMDGILVKAGNDANVAALGEMWQGGGKGCKSLVMVTLGTGVGGGIIIDEKIVAGAHGAGGEIGHITVNPHENISCNCKRKGCLEQYCSATGLARLARERLEQEHEESLLDQVENVTAKDVFDAYKKQDKTAGEIVEKFARILGQALSNIACVADPEIFVLGGGVSKAGEVLLKAVEQPFREKAFPSCADTRFALASLGNDAGMYGCVRLILE